MISRNVDNKEEILEILFMDQLNVKFLVKFIFKGHGAVLN